MDADDAFAIAVALDAEDRTETGWSRNPGERNETLKMFGIEVAPLTSETPVDPMLAPPPAHLAEQQLAEMRAEMAGLKPPNPSDD